MNIRIEEAFNDCFERMLSGESLESCLSSYPEYAIELDSMLRTTYDVKRKAYPIQPRQEFKYWARVRMQNVQHYGIQSKVKEKSTSFNLRRNLAISMAALLVFVIASSGTVAASSNAMPDEPLYGVKLAVEQAQVTFTPSETDKAEVYARLAEKRAQEIAVMAVKGNDDKVIATTRIMNYQLQQVEDNLLKFETASAADATRYSPPAMSPVPATPSTIWVPSAATANVTQPQTITDNRPEAAGAGIQDPQAIKRAASIKKAREAINTSTAKSLTILQNALIKAPDSVKPSLNNVINQTKTTNKRIQLQNTLNSGPIRQGMQNPDEDEHKPVTNPTTKPGINRNTIINPVDRFNKDLNHDNDTKVGR